MIPFVLALVALAVSREDASPDAEDVLMGILFQYPGTYPTYTFYILWPFNVMEEDIWLHGEDALERAAWHQFNEDFDKTDIDNQLTQLQGQGLPPVRLDLRIHEAGIRDTDGPGEQGAVWTAVVATTTGPFFSQVHQRARDYGTDPRTALIRFLNEYLTQLYFEQLIHPNQIVLGVDGPGLPKTEPLLTEDDRRQLEAVRLLGVPDRNLEDRVLWSRLTQAPIAFRWRKDQS